MWNLECEMNKIAVVVINQKGKEAANALERGFDAQEVSCFYPAPGRLKGLTARIFDKDKFEGIVFIMAAGIVVRMIAAHLKDKYRDPAIVVVDDERRFAVSLLSGHEGKANDLAVRVANILGAEPVITTASESKKKIVIGLGCRKGAEKKEIIAAIRYALKKIKSSIKEARYIASVDLKKDEAGLKQACVELGIPLRIISSDIIRNFNGKYQKSEFVQSKTGLWGVSEPCALLSARCPKLILPKIKISKVTIAAAREA